MKSIHTDKPRKSTFSLHTHGGLLVCFLCLMALSACSSDDSVITGGFEEETVAVAPGAMLSFDTTARIDRAGEYHLPEGASRLSWTCTGSVSVDVESEQGFSSQTCEDSQQSVTVRGPGTVTVQLGLGAFLLADLR